MPAICWQEVLYVIYSMRGVVKWLIKYKAKPSALSTTRPQPECHKSCKARHDALNGLKYLSLVLDLNSQNFMSKSHTIAASLVAGHRPHPSSSVPKCFSGNQRGHDWSFELI